MITRHIKALLITLSVCTLLAGCSSNKYMQDRTADAADIFTIAGGYGIGAKGRVGPVHVGAFWNRDSFGLKGGHYLPFAADLKWSKELTTPIPIYLGYYDGFKSGEEEFDPNALSSARLREKHYSATHKAVYSVVDDERWFYYSQIEFAIGIGPTLRLGFNPGELLDYILGFAYVDIYDDDVELR